MDFISSKILIKMQRKLLLKDHGQLFYVRLINKGMVSHMTNRIGNCEITVEVDCLIKIHHMNISVALLAPLIKKLACLVVFF